MIFFARATRGLRRMGRVAWSSSCSWNAHDQNVLVRRAQSRIDQATLENEMGKWEDARSGRSISPHPLRNNERVWRIIYSLVRRPHFGRPKRCQEQFPGPCIPGTAFIRTRKLFLTPFILPRCPSCSQNAHGETVLVRCAQ